MTPHNRAKKEEIAKTVILFGDPVRARKTVEKFFENPKLVNEVRGALYYTGEYKGKTFTIGTSGMGAPSMCIYAHELFRDYGVERIIRVGTSGAYTRDLNMGDIVLAEDAFPDSDSYSRIYWEKKIEALKATKELNDKLLETAKERNIKVTLGRVHTTDHFYDPRSLEDIAKFTGNAKCVDMECYALFFCAQIYKKQAAALVSITDALYNLDDRLPSDVREKICDKSIEIVLNTAF